MHPPRTPTILAALGLVLLLASPAAGDDTPMAAEPAPAAEDEPRITLYMTSWCGYCRKAKAHLDRREIPYELKDVDVRAVKQEMLAKTGRSGIPVVDIDGRILQGYQAESLDAMLDTAGL